MAIDYHLLKDRAALAAPSLPAYVHIPFCSKHCWYCDFNVYERLGRLIRPYTAALTREIDQVGEVLDGRAQLSAVYFGGGTPSLIGANLLGKILETLTARFGREGPIEVTVEANPSNVSARVLAALVEHGYNRVSIGVQSLTKARLSGLDRLHSARDALETLTDAKTAGFESVSADLLYGVPGQTLSEFQDGLMRVVDRGVDHVSTYALTLYDDHAKNVASTMGDPAPDDAMASFYGSAVEILTAAGFEHYEVSNFARPGHRCRYNESVWRGNEYLAFGCGAHGYFGGRRYSLMKHPGAYIEAVEGGQPTVESIEAIGPIERLVEHIAFRLRTSEGIDLKSLLGDFGVDLLVQNRGEIDELVGHGLAILSGDRLRLTDSGMIVADAVAARLIPENSNAEGEPYTPPVRLFIAVNLPPDVVEGLGKEQRKLAEFGEMLRLVDESGLHLTLCFIGDVPGQESEVIEQGVRTSISSEDPFVLALGEGGSFPGPEEARVVWMGVEGELRRLSSLQKIVSEELRNLGYRIDRRPFSPHITLARVSRRASQRDRQDIAAAARKLSCFGLGSFDVRGVELMESFLSTDGATYAIVARIPLISRN